MKLETRHKIARFFQYFVLIAVGFIMIYPLLWMISATFKDNSEIFSGISLWIKHPTLDGYRGALNNFGGSINILQAMLNTYSYVIPKVICTVVSACVAAYLDAVNPHIGSPIYRSEIEHHIAAFPRFWHRKTASIPQFLILMHAFAHTRETRLDAERHQYLAIVGARCGGSAIGDGILPQAIEVLPRIALHYWAWIFCPYIIHIDVFCPFGLDFVAGRCILRTHRRGYHRQHCQRCHQSFF